MTNDEWILVGQAKQGNAHAFARLYERYYHDLYRFAYCYMQQAEAAEDAVMNSIEKAYVRLGDLRKNSSFKSWLYQITANECRAQLRKMPVYMEDATPPEPRYEESGYSTPEIRELLSHLSEIERLVITLSVFSGYNSSEIAALLHKRPGSIRSIKSRALSSLRTQVEQSKNRKEVSLHE